MWEDMQICEWVDAHMYRRRFHIYIRTLLSGSILTQVIELARNFSPVHF